MTTTRTSRRFDWRSLNLIAAVFLLSLGGCGQGGEKPAGGSGSVTGNRSAAEGPVKVMNTLPHFRLASQRRKPVTQQDLEGYVWIANLFTTSCRDGCPTEAAELAKLREEFGADADLEEVRFVSITSDPAKDTPAALAEYAGRSGQESGRWTLLTGKPEDLWGLMKEGFDPDAGTPSKPGAVMEHPHRVTLVDRGRRVRGRYDIMDAGGLEQLRSDVRRVLRDPPGPITAEKSTEAPVPQDGKIFVPPEIRTTGWMKPRAEAQRKTLPRFEVFHDFTFTDRLPESGIRFVHKVVDDAGRHYKAVHYDHGNGVVVADVDGDGLHDLYLVNQVGANHLYRNLGSGKFEQVEGAGGAAVEDRISVTASFADTDNDGDPDLYVTTVKQGNLLFENDGSGNFKDVTASSGIGYRGHSSSAVFFDYDKDGLLDLFLTNVGVYTTDEIGPDGAYVGLPDAFSGHLRNGRDEQSHLFRNTGGNRFLDVSRETGLVDTSWTGAATPIDLNEDGWIDLYVLSMQGHDEYYENDQGSRFLRKSREIFPRTPWGAMGVQTLDFDNDGRMDIYVTDMHTDMTDDALQLRRAWYAEKMKMTETISVRLLKTDGNHVLGNAFFHNEGGGVFREISEEIGAENYWPWGLSAGDLNADGWEDVFITSSMNFMFRYGVNSLLLNNKGKTFLDSEFILGVEPRRDGRTAEKWFDLDCDGADKTHSLCGGRTGKYEAWGALGSRSSVIFDFDNDGDLDIITSDFNSEPMVLVSNLAERKPVLRYLMVDLEGTSSNRNGLGAVVKVRAAGREYTKVMDGQSGYLSQSVYPLYFGLDQAASVEEVRVTWPSSGEQVVAGPIETNQTLKVVEP